MRRRDTTDTWLDPKAIRRLRLAEGSSEQEIADACGVSVAKIRGLEEDVADGSVTVDVVCRLALRLGVSLAELMRAPSSREDARDDCDVLEAALTFIDHQLGRDEIAEGLGWDLDRTDGALQQLRERLARRGTRLTDGPTVRIESRTTLLSERQREQLAAGHYRRRGLTGVQAGLLLRIVKATLELHRLSQPDRALIGGFIAAGLVIDRRRQMLPSPDLLACLGRPTADASA